MRNNCNSAKCSASPAVKPSNSSSSCQSGGEQTKDKALSTGVPTAGPATPNISQLRHASRRSAPKEDQSAIMATFNDAIVNSLLHARRERQRARAHQPLPYQSLPAAALRQVTCDL
ncbi:hypothetical protein BK025_08620 [Sodalis sp. TME1]|nr:hypothetical protein BK025_08620 [Sodalis sp. TME1]